jgi:replicative DNA helicase
VHAASVKSTSFPCAAGSGAAAGACYVRTIHHPAPRVAVPAVGRQARALAAAGSTAQRPDVRVIEPDADYATQCIAVDHPSRLYVTDDYVVTHNTALAINMGENVRAEHGAAGRRCSR